MLRSLRKSVVSVLISLFQTHSPVSQTIPLLYVRTFDYLLFPLWNHYNLINLPFYYTHIQNK